MSEKTDLWSITSHINSTDKEGIMRAGNVFQISNGYMGYRGTLDEFGQEQLVGITLAGIFDKVGDAWREPVNAPNGAFTSLEIDGAAISTLETQVLSHQQKLELANATFERHTEFEHNKKKIAIKSKRFLSAKQPNLMVVEFSFNTDSDAEITINTGIDYNIWDLNGPHLEHTETKNTDNVLTVASVTQELKKKLVVAELIDFEDGTEHHIVRNRQNLRSIHLNAKANKTYTFYKYIAVAKEGDFDDKDIIHKASDIVKEASILGYTNCLDAHNTEWACKWTKCDVKIDGDDEAQLALRYSIFQLLMVAPNAGSANSIPARALSGQVYKGAIFWDTEMFMFPFFVYTYPQIAIELLQYRINTLDGARIKAQTEGIGYKGAFYAWESQDTGEDACTYFNIGDPHTKRDLRTHFRDKQIHISGDVAIAMWEYFKLTDDDTLLREGGAEVILECARFYYSYAYFKKDKNRYELLDVIGPDEYHERVNNNIFTNKIASETFKVAIETVKYLKTNYPNELDNLLNKIGITEELPLIEDAFNKLYIPEPDPKTGVIEQFDAYYKLEDVSVEDVKKRMIHPNEYLGAGQGVAVQTQVIKQADTVMMLNLFKEHYSHEVKKANWEFYEPRTEHGSSLSACAYALVAADIGKTDWAYTYFLKTAKLDLEAKYKVFVGTIFMGGSHPAANGGAWMSTIFGFAGLKADMHKVVINPKLYKKWKSVIFRTVYKGDSFKIQITPNKVIVKSSHANKQTRQFIIGGKQCNCQVGKSIELNY